jgi:8-oxo-dGTP diphosphatase
MAARKKAPPKKRPRDDEASFLAAYDPKAFDPIAVTVDVALVTAVDGALHTLLVQRTEHPAKNRWALPGGFVQTAESLEATARRVLRDKAGIEGVYLEQLYTFGAPKRDPRMRVITVAYVALVDAARFERAAATNMARVGELVVPWEGETGGAVQVAAEGEALPIAFDHDLILGMVVKRMRGKLDYTPIGFQLLPEAFTLRQLQRVHETVLHRAVNKDSFRRRMLASGQLEATGERQEDVGHRPAELYRFIRRSAV